MQEILQITDKSKKPNTRGYVAREFAESQQTKIKNLIVVHMLQEILQKADINNKPYTRAYVARIFTNSRHE